MGILSKLIDFLKQRLSTEDLAEFLKILEASLRPGLKGDYGRRESKPRRWV